MSVSMKVGETIRLRGTIRSYTGVVVESAPNRITVRIGDVWNNIYEFRNNEWVPVAHANGRDAPKTRIVGAMKEVNRG